MMDLRTDLVALTDDFDKTLQQHIRTVDRIHIAGYPGSTRDFISGNEAALDIVVMRLRELLAAHPPTGFDVEIAVGAPDSNVWRWKACFDSYVDAAAWLYGLCKDDLKMQKPDFDIYDIYSTDFGRVMSRYRILPAGSPAPTEASE